MVLVERILGIAHTYAPHIFRTKGKHTPPTLARGQFLVRRAADVVVGRRPKKRSLHEVNEHFSVKPNIAVSTHLGARPISCQKGGRCGSGSQIEKAEFTICK